ncbi:hypothetical protein Psch_01251 [Pelotomaculum schinkii]|uniref:YcdB/YcdC repeated domain-containing protein n=1 Tax=Pelotomaculum schinkii TaxID=78350 RepID=A0A4Y7RFX0_9FIRM|nr:YcdB/YcdC domain-containing protein [Pelotomaculum schinkii]TEB07696.1 hypothetical protein Psch_01251 [Pelotomaculum schinkii]
MKKVKRTAVAVLAASMLLTTPAWAAEQDLSVVQERGGDAVELFSKAELTEAQRQALEKMYQIIPELKELSLQNVEYNEDKTAWGGYLTDGSPDVTPDNRRIRASIAFDAKTGDLVNFDIYNPEWAAEKMPSATLVEEKAAEFTRKLLGDRLKEYEMGETISYSSGSSLDDKGNKIITMTSAHVYFNRLINGVPLLNSGFQVSVDSAGHITEFRKEKDDNPDPAKFPDPSRAMTKDAAEKAFAGLVEMKLSYNISHSWLCKGGEETIPVLMYYPSFSGFIDAETGEPLEDSGGTLQQSQRVILNGEGKKFYAATPEEGARLLAEEFGVDMAGMEFGSVRVHDLPVTSGYQFKEYSWGSETQQETDSEPDWNGVRFVNLKTIADTGEIVGFGIQDDSGRGKQGTVSKEDAQKTAVQFLQRYLEPGAAELELTVFPSEENIPAWVDKSKLTDQMQQRPQFFIQFSETYQGIPVADSSHIVRVDALTGKVTEFGIGSRNASVTLPDSNDAVTADVAKAEYLNRHPLRLVYIWPEYYQQKAPSPQLVYLPVSGERGYIDALTGKTVVLERN